MESPYEVLGLDPGADERAVVDAYRERVKSAHPDHGGSKAEFERVREAYRRITEAGAEAAADGRTASPGTAGSAARTAGPAPGNAGGGAAGPGTNGTTTGNGAGTWAPDPDTPPGAGAGSTSDDEEGRSRVEYLNYDVLDDHGWDLGDEDLFEKAAEADLDPVDYGRLLVQEDETLLEAAERCGFDWPFACRGGACTNCAVAVADGEIPVPPGYILPEELIDTGIRLSCITAPTTDEAQVVYNVKHLPGVDELRLQPNRFERTRSDD